MLLRAKRATADLLYINPDQFFIGTIVLLTNITGSGIQWVIMRYYVSLHILAPSLLHDFAHWDCFDCEKPK